MLQPDPHHLRQAIVEFCITLALLIIAAIAFVALCTFGRI